MVNEVWADVSSFTDPKYALSHRVKDLAKSYARSINGCFHFDAWDVYMQFVEYLVFVFQYELCPLLTDYYE